MAIFPTIYFLLLVLSTVVSVNSAPKSSSTGGNIQTLDSDNRPKPEMDPALMKEEETIYIDAEEANDLPVPEMDPALIKDEATIDLDDWTEERP